MKSNSIDEITIIFTLAEARVILNLLYKVDTTEQESSTEFCLRTELITLIKANL